MTGRFYRSHPGTMKDLRILLVEPHLVLRQTAASTVRALNIGEVHQAGSIATASRMVNDTSYDIIILAIENDDGMEKVAADLSMVESIRKGKTQCLEDAVVIVSTTSCDKVLLDAVRTLSVNKVLIKPFRVRDLIDTLMTRLSDSLVAP